MKYDIAIFVSERYADNIPLIVQSIDKHIKEKPSRIYCISKAPIQRKIYGIKYVLDKDASPLNVGVQSGWLKQQYLKLFQDVTSDNYLVVDGDILFTKDISLFDGDKANLFVSKMTRYANFDRYTEEMTGLKPQSKYTFVNDVMFFQRSIIKEMTGDAAAFIEKSNKTIGDGCMLSEYELYGTYIMANHSDKYNIVKIGRSDTPPFKEYHIKQL